MLNTKEIIEKYGKPNELGTYLIPIDLPYPMKLAWDKKTIVNKMRCHKLVAINFRKSFEQILAHYGKTKISKLGIDLYGGCFNYRAMRGGSDYSRHSWGIAIDLDPERNQLQWGKDKAEFAKPEYEKLMEIFAENGFINLGVEKNYDWMHFEISK